MPPVTAFGFILGGMVLTWAASFVLPPALKERQGDEAAGTVAVGAFILVGFAILGACSFGFGLFRYVEILFLLFQDDQAFLIFGLMLLFSLPFAYCGHRTRVIWRERVNGERALSNPWVWSSLTVEWGLLFLPALLALMMAIVKSGQP